MYKPVFGGDMESMKQARKTRKKVTKTGVVKSLEGHMAVAVTTREEACGHCKARESCEALGGTGANATVRALNTVHAKVGDTVTIAMASASLLKASFFIYMVPILALIGGILVGFLGAHLLDIQENIAVGASSGLALAWAFFWLRKKGRDLGKRKEFIPEIIAKKTFPATLSRVENGCPVNQ